MVSQYITEFSKYFIALFASFYTYECFSVFRFQTEGERSGIYIRQYIFMFFVHVSCFLPIYVKTGKIEYIFFFLFQQIAMYATIVLYHLIYPQANRLVINNMCFLTAVGFTILTRLSYNRAVRQFVIAVFSSVIAMVVPELIMRVKNWRAYTWVYGGVGIVSLGAVLVLGAVTHGAKLSFSILGVSFQPSEFIKIVFAFFIASLLCRSRSFRNVALSAVLAGAHVIILVLSKDLGSALIYFVAYVVMVYIATGQKWYLLAGLSGGSGAAYLSFRIFNHVQVRVQAWRDPWSVIDREGYQITQSLFAIGCGGLFGLGLCQGSPSSIPFVTTDFIFSAIAEEMGILFSLCLILVYISCFIMFMQIAISIKDDFYRLTVAGLGVTYLFQIFLTIGGGIKFIPLTGVTLPLISYGGSSVLSTIMMFSVIQGLYLAGGKKNATGKATQKTERTKKEKTKKLDRQEHRR